MKGDIGFFFFAAGIAVIALAVWWIGDHQLKNDEARCRYSVEVMKLDTPDKEKVAVAYCMQKKGYTP